VKKENGGSAYPYMYETSERFVGNSYRTVVHHGEGMSMRDYFAGQALTGIIASDCSDKMAVEPRAKLAYRIADAMLAEREIEK